MSPEDRKHSDKAGAAKWYELFSRGARDWLRHDEKVREAVRANLPEIIAGGDVINDGARTASRTFSSWRSQSRAPRENSSYHLAAPALSDCLRSSGFTALVVHLFRPRRYSWASSVVT